MAETKISESEKTVQFEFLNIISHELKNPLTPLLAHAELLSNESLGPLNKEQAKAVESISRNAMRLRHLISDVLDLASLETGNISFNIEEIDITDVIEGVINDLKASAKEKDIEITFNSSPLPLISGDKHRLGQVFANLINNAIKFTPSLGEIKIRAEKKGYDFLISVQDNGIGIAKKDINKIFEKFYQADKSASRKHGGTGLGLTICKGIIAAHGGDIWAESEPGKGSALYVKLPYKSIGKPTQLFSEVLRGGGA